MKRNLHRYSVMKSVLFALLLMVSTIAAHAAGDPSCMDDLRGDAHVTHYFIPALALFSDYRCRKMEGQCLFNVKQTVFIFNADVGKRKLSDATCKFGWGSHGNCLVPCKSVAADPRFHSFGEQLYFPSLKGTMCNGLVHDGVVQVDDVGGAIKGRDRFDFFIGSCSKMQGDVCVSPMGLDLVKALDHRGYCSYRPPAAAAAPRPANPTPTPRPTRVHQKIDLQDLLKAARQDGDVDPTRILSPSQVEADLDLLQYALMTGYIGHTHMSAAAFNRAMDALDRIDGRMSARALRDRIDQALIALPDASIRAELGGEPSALRKTKLPRVGANRGANSKTWSVRMAVLGGKNILIIAFARLPSADDPSWLGFLDAALGKFAGADEVVIDLRGLDGVNSSSDATMALKLARLMIDPHHISYPRFTDFLEESPSAQVLRTRAAEVEIQSSSMKSYLANEILQTGGEALPSRITPVFNGPVAILIDGGCSARCEDLVLAFARHPKAKKIGAATAGRFHFRKLGSLILPNSRIEVVIPTLFREMADGRYLEQTGIAPDLAVPDGRDALDFIPGSR